MSKHTITFYPLGNADTTLIELENGQTILWDYANKQDPEDKNEKRCDLPSELDKSVNGNYDVVCFTHADDDHIRGFSNYFYLEHAKKYQDDERKTINEIWVPAAVLLDKTLENEAKILKAEARHRLKNKEGIRVFSRPKKMKEWCEEQDDISYENVKHLFVDAGTLVPGFSKEEEGVEFFVHAPFYSESEDFNRNDEAIVAQATFNDDCQTKLMFGSDNSHEAWSDIVKITRNKGNEERLIWDLFHVSHHCSYTAIGPERGTDKTEPNDEVAWLFESQGKNRSRIISPSWEIPEKGSDHDNDQPPHRQAANYYEKVINEKNGAFKVTMEEPSQSKPEPMVFEIDGEECLKHKMKKAGAATFPSKQKTPRAGNNG